MPWQCNVKTSIGPSSCIAQETRVAIVEDGIAAFTGNNLDELQSRYELLGYCVLSQRQCLNQSSHSYFRDRTRTGLHQSVLNR